MSIGFFFILIVASAFRHFKAQHTLNMCTGVGVIASYMDEKSMQIRYNYITTINNNLLSSHEYKAVSPLCGFVLVPKTDIIIVYGVCTKIYYP